MKWLRSVTAAWQRLIQLPFLGRSSFALALGLLIVAIAQDWHVSHPDEAVWEAIELAQRSNQAVPAGIRRLERVLPYLNLWVALGSVVLVLVIWRRWNQPQKLLLPLSIASISLIVWAIASELVDYIVHAQMTEFGEPPVPAAFFIKQLIIAVTLLSVPGALWAYLRCQILDRYALRTFMQPLVFCFVAFCSLYIIADLLDNMKDFQDAKAKFRDVLGFYASLLPFVFVTVVPYSLLLAALYSLTRMSRANELISLLSTGRSLARVLRPVLLCSAYVAALAAAANYYWAPRAEESRKAVVRALSSKGARTIRAESIMFRNSVTRRTWYVSSFPLSLRGGRERMRGLQMREEGPDGRLVRSILAPTATWTPSGGWRFYDGGQVLYEKGIAIAAPPFPVGADGQRMLAAPEITETPWSLVSYALKADFMGVPELLAYLKSHPEATEEKIAPFRTHLWHRFALPWQAIAIMLFGIPLAVSYSRRGALGGIASCIFIFAIFRFADNLFLNLGKGGHLPPWLTVWMPHLIFGSLGLVLFHYRSLNRDLPRLRLFAKKAAQLARPRRRRQNPAPAAT